MNQNKNTIKSESTDQEKSVEDLKWELKIKTGDEIEGRIKGVKAQPDGKKKLGLVRKSKTPVDKYSNDKIFYLGLKERSISERTKFEKIILEKMRDIYGSIGINDDKYHGREEGYNYYVKVPEDLPKGYHFNLESFVKNEEVLKEIKSRIISIDDFKNYDEFMKKLEKIENQEPLEGKINETIKINYYGDIIEVDLFMMNKKYGDIKIGFELKKDIYKDIDVEKVGELILKKIGRYNEKVEIEALTPVQHTIFEI